MKKKKGAHNGIFLESAFKTDAINTGCRENIEE